ncbi:MAG: hypothetical protein AAEJ47_04055 [Planctomycetota bacterium]
MPPARSNNAPLLPEGVTGDSRPYPLAGYLLLLTFWACAGCSTVHLKPTVIDIADYSREKDIRTYVITVDSKMEDEDYQDWTRDHIEEQRLNEVNPEYEGVPIYEIHYHFVMRRVGYRPRRIAFLIWRSAPEDPSTMNHMFTYIGSNAPMQNWILR